MSKVPDEVKATVIFVFVKDSSDKLRPTGTAFFVSVPDEKKPDRHFGYLVTAKHVLLNSEQEYFQSVFIRINKRAGGSDIIEVPLAGDDAFHIHTHWDETVDIAVLPMLPPPDIYDIKTIPQKMIITKDRFKEAKIGEGDEVFFTGLFTPFIGSGRNYPIVRFGRVAMLTDERIPWNGKSLDLYLIECQSFGGNSGSPVFFYLNPTREPGSIVLGPPTFLLAGIMMGTFLETREIRIVTALPFSVENVGIAAVVPGYYLHEILSSEQLTKTRASVPFDK